MEDYDDAPVQRPKWLGWVIIIGMILVVLGIMGEYLGRVFNESKRRPPYFANTYNDRQMGDEPRSVGAPSRESE